MVLLSKSRSITWLNPTLCLLHDYSSNTAWRKNQVTLKLNRSRVLILQGNHIRCLKKTHSPTLDEDWKYFSYFPKLNTFFPTEKIGAFTRELTELITPTSNPSATICPCAVIWHHACYHRWNIRAPISSHSFPCVLELISFHCIAWEIPSGLYHPSSTLCRHTKVVLLLLS